MVEKFYPLTVKAKIISLNLILSISCLIAASSIFIAYDYYSNKHASLRAATADLEYLSNINQSIESASIKDIDNLLRLKNNIQAAFVLDKDGNVLYEYKDQDFRKNNYQPKLQSKQSSFYSNKFLSLKKDINNNLDNFKQVQLISSLAPIYQHSLNLSILFFITLALMTLVSFFTTRKFTTQLGINFGKILDTISISTKDKNFKVRCKVDSNDEIGLIGEKIDVLLEQIGKEAGTLNHKQLILNEALTNAKQTIWSWDLKNNIIDYNPEFMLNYGYAKSKIKVSVDYITSLTHPNDVNKIQQAITNIVSGIATNCNVEYRLKDTENNWHWIMAKAHIIERNKYNTPIKIAGTMVDVTEQKVNYEEMILYKQLFEHTKEGVIVFDTKGNIVSTNPAFEKITNFSDAMAKGKKLTFFGHDKHDKTFTDTILSELEKNNFWQDEIWAKKPNGDTYPIRLNISEINLDGKIVNYVALLSDITKTKRDADKLKFLANYDTLTGLPNRTQFFEHLNYALAHAKQHNKKVALLFCDLDHFKHINDSLGHPVGDKLLKEAAIRFTKNVRKDDVVARIGGDEFTLILDDVDSQRSVLKIADGLLSAFSKTFNIDKHELAVGVSMGIAIFPDDGVDAETLVKNADVAMYNSKKKGRNVYQLYRNEMNANSMQRLQMEHDLSVALKNDELEIYYQPKIKIATGEIVGVEALLRWHHPKHGKLSPAQFIPLAEETGLIIPIGKWVLTNSCKQNSKWVESGFKDLTVAVNLSACQFRTGDIAEIISQALWESSLPPSNFEVELTESLIMENAEKSVLMLKVLKQMGIKIAIDDFGTGYSSLSYLKSFPIDSIKIDKSFVKDLNDDPEDAAIITAILAMAKRMKMKVVAEGVEKQSQLEFLQNEECDEMQGYLFSEPLTAVDFTFLLENYIANPNCIKMYKDIEQKYKTGNVHNPNSDNRYKF